MVGASGSSIHVSFIYRVIIRFHMKVDRQLSKITHGHRNYTKELRLKRLSIDGTLLQSFEFKEKTGYSGKHRRVGVKASLIVDATGLPLSVVLARGNAADIALAEDTLSRISEYDSFKTTILADKGYDSRRFRKFAFCHGIYPRIPKRSYTTEGKDPYRSHMYRYDKDEAKYRFIVERTNAWFKSFRRLRNRFDYHVASFELWLYLAIIIVCVRRLVL